MTDEGTSRCARRAALAVGVSVALLAGCKRAPSAEGAAAEAQSKGVVDVSGAKQGEGTGADSDCCMGRNPCKGQGGCAVPESHACKGHNECKGRGGCNAHCPK